MNGRQVYVPPPAHRPRTLFGLPLTWRLIGVALAQALGLFAVFGVLYLALVLGLALGPPCGLN